MQRPVGIFYGCLVAFTVLGFSPQQASAQSSRSESLSIPRGLPAVDITAETQNDRGKADGREAASNLCRDLQAYSEMRRLPGAASDLPMLFEALQPLCATADQAQRTAVYNCKNNGPSPLLLGICATNWFDAVLYGYSWCSDLQKFCVLLGGEWSER